MCFLLSKETWKADPKLPNLPVSPSLQAVNSQTPQLQPRCALQPSHAPLQLALHELLLLLPRRTAQRAMQTLQVPQQRQDAGVAGVGRGT